MTTSNRNARNCSTSITKWFSSQKKKRARRLRKRRHGSRTLFMESLEHRQLMAADLPWTIADGVLRIEGSEGADQLEFDGQTRELTVNGQRHTIGDQINRIRFDGAVGDDTAVLRGSAEKETVELRPGLGILRGDGLAVIVANVESIKATSGGGDDRAFFHDGDGDDRLFAKPNVVAMAGDEYYNQASSFGSVHVHPDSGGYDAAYTLNLVLAAEPKVNASSIEVSNNAETFDYHLPVFDHLMMTNGDGAVVYQRNDYREDAQILAGQIEVKLHQIAETAKVEKAFQDKMEKIAAEEATRLANAQSDYEAAVRKANADHASEEDKHAWAKEKRASVESLKARVKEEKERVNNARESKRERTKERVAKSYRALLKDIRAYLWTLKPPCFGLASYVKLTMPDRIDEVAQDIRSQVEEKPKDGGEFLVKTGNDAKKTFKDRLDPDITITQALKQIERGAAGANLQKFIRSLNRELESIGEGIKKTSDGLVQLRDERIENAGNYRDITEKPRISADMEELRKTARDDRLKRVEDLGETHLPSIEQIRIEFPDALDGLSSISVPTADEIFNEITIDVSLGSAADFLQTVANGESLVEGIITPIGKELNDLLGKVFGPDKEHRPYSGPVEPDRYEVDGQTIPTISTDGSPMVRNIVWPLDIDYAQFRLDKWSDVVIETSGKAGDTVMRLFGPDGQQIAMDNDSGARGTFSRIERQGDNTLAPGVYTVRVEEDGRDDEIAGYEIRVTANPAHLTVRVEYGYDTNNFFDTEEKKEVLQLVPVVPLQREQGLDSLNCHSSRLLGDCGDAALAGRELTSSVSLSIQSPVTCGAGRCCCHT